MNGIVDKFRIMGFSGSGFFSSRVSESAAWFNYSYGRLRFTGLSADRSVRSEPSIIIIIYYLHFKALITESV